jgi:hypothetical protein
MREDWLVERCVSTDPIDIRMRGMALLKLSDANKRKLLDRSEPFRKWVESEWKPFINQMSSGDELWRFHSPPQTWARRVGRAGYSIVRNGVVVHSLVTLLN